VRGRFGAARATSIWPESAAARQIGFVFSGPDGQPEMLKILSGEE